MARVVQFLAAVALLLGFVTVAAICLKQRADAGKGMPDYSLYSNEDGGLRPLVGQLRQLGYQPIPVTRPIHLTGQQGLLIMAEPGERGPFRGFAGPTEDQAAGVLDWVAEGNTLVLWGEHEHGVHRELNVQLHPAPRREEDYFPAEIGLKTVYTRRIDNLMLATLTSIRVTKGPWISLWQVPQQGPGAVMIPHGKGRVLVIADPSLLTKEGRELDDNALVLPDLISAHAPDGRVLFDEYWHGFQASNNFFTYLQRHGQLALVLQVGVALLIAGWSAAVRLGPAAPKPAAARADAVDYAAAMARIYHQAGATKRLTAGMARDFLTALTGYLRLRRSATAKEILTAWGRRHTATKEKLAHLLDHVETLKTGASLSPRRLLHLAQALDQFRQEHLAPKTARQRGRMKSRV